MKDKGVKWFPELLDKRKFVSPTFESLYSLFCNLLGRNIKLHLYWSMKNCGGDGDALRNLVDAIPMHYQVCMIYAVHYTLLEGGFPCIMCLQVSFFIRIESGKCFGMPNLDVSAGRS